MSLNACEQGGDAILQSPEDIFRPSPENFPHKDYSEAQAIQIEDVERLRGSRQNDRLRDRPPLEMLVVVNCRRWRSQAVYVEQAVEWLMVVRDAFWT